jgi:hypothetical protein
LLFGPKRGLELAATIFDVQSGREQRARRTSVIAENRQVRYLCCAAKRSVQNGSFGKQLTLQSDCTIAFFPNFMVVQMVRGDSAERALPTFMTFAQVDADARKPNAMRRASREVTV